MQNSQTNNNEDWSSSKLLDLVEFKKGKKPSILEEKAQDGYIPYIDIEAFEKGSIHRYTDDKSVVVSDKDKDILVVWDGARAGLVGKASGVVGSTLMRLTPKNVNRDFLLLFLKSKYNEINANHRGTGIPHVNPDIFWDIKVPLPPSSEQQVIAAKINHLLPIIELNRMKLSKARILVNKFRQAILAAAVTGKLTEVWRIKNKNVENASDLIDKIMQYKLANAKNQGHKEKIIQLYSNLNYKPDFDLPETWLSCQIDQIGEVTNGSTPSRKVSSYWNGNIPWISSGEVKNNFINDTREKITQAGFDNSSVKLLPKGTVLIAMIGEGKTRGQSAVLNIEATTNQNIAAIKIEHNLINPKYLWYWFQYQYENTRNFGGGSSQKALNCQRVRELPFIMPPFKEQLEIVSNIKKYFDLADSIEMKIESAERKVSQLTQAILAKTFNPQEASLE